MNRVLPAKLLDALRPDVVSRLELPSEILRQSRHRVRLAAVIGLAAYAVFLLFELLGLQTERTLEHSIDLTHDMLGLVLCAALWLVARIRRIPDRTVLAVALATEVILCALISVEVSWAGFIRHGHVVSLSWVIPVIILFPLLVPTRPRTTLFVSILSAATMPASVWLLSSRGLIQEERGDYLALAVTGAVACGIAVVASRTVYGAGRQVAAAREAGSYQMIELLGRGGMGEVWKAHHSLLARPAAVKLIRPEMMQGGLEARDAVMKRFTREARVTASLCSPHTVSLFDFGVTSEGVLYYAMELLDGLNVEHFVYRFGPVAPPRAVSWLRQVCHSLAEAHGRGLVHRDIKPSNVYLCHYGRDYDFVKVLDFGLTRPAEVGEATELTHPGARLGTPGYMAPEQIFGLPADPRSDLYALGCVAYWLLAGGKPFESDSGAELLRMHARVDPPPLSSMARQPVPPRLEALVMSCLSKEPDDRPGSADLVRAGLDACLDGGRWTTDQAAAWWKEHMAGD